MCERSGWVGGWCFRVRPVAAPFGRKYLWIDQSGTSAGACGRMRGKRVAGGGGGGSTGNTFARLWNVVPPPPSHTPHPFHTHTLLYTQQALRHPLSIEPREPRARTVREDNLRLFTVDGEEGTDVPHFCLGEEGDAGPEVRDRHGGTRCSLRRRARSFYLVY